MAATAACRLAPIHFEGDRQPRGYSRYDAVLGRYVESRRTPITGPDPEPAPRLAPAAARLPDGVAHPLAGPRAASALALRVARRA
jgi:hypothetical protein